MILHYHLLGSFFGSLAFSSSPAPGRCQLTTWYLGLRNILLVPLVRFFCWSILFSKNQLPSSQTNGSKKDKGCFVWCWVALYDVVVGNPPIVPLIRGLLSCYVCTLYSSNHVKTMFSSPRVGWLRRRISLRRVPPGRIPSSAWSLAHSALESSPRVFWIVQWWTEEMWWVELVLWYWCW